MSLLLPLLYFAVGALLDRWHRLNEKLISSVLLYIMVPLVMFDSVYSADLREFSIYLLFTFTVSIAMALSARFVHQNGHMYFGKNVLSCIYGYFNIGWFGMPIADALYGIEGMKVAAAMYFGNMLFGNTIGYYLFAKEKFGFGKALTKIVTMPTFYAIGLGWLFNVKGIELPAEAIRDCLMAVAGETVSILGMGLAGIGLSRSLKCHHVWPMACRLVITRFVLIAIVNTCSIFAFVYLLSGLGLRGDMLALLYILPVAANVIAFSAELGHELHSVSAVVGASTVLAILVLPVYYVVFTGR